jgi:hypothetical protein
VFSNILNLDVLLEEEIRSKICQSHLQCSFSLKELDRLSHLVLWVSIDEVAIRYFDGLDFGI